MPEPDRHEFNRGDAITVRYESVYDKHPEQTRRGTVQYAGDEKIIVDTDSAKYYVMYDDDPTYVEKDGYRVGWLNALVKPIP